MIYSINGEKAITAGMVYMGLLTKLDTGRLVPHHARQLSSTVLLGNDPR